ncbi:MAG: precorrin-2 C(20)-methyltransferase [Deltaproteobacteria bacterium]|jgi:precorrin-2/cobalt-factor-2 C20-methyltransferase|nr:precorrin-2 C(20)-methyltransferase [Deltaproteobacteria bacterium]
MTQASGTLYGIGVGPGDPDLLTIKAVKILNQVDVVFTASSTKNEYSLARNIASPHLKAGTNLENLEFPMTEEKGALNAAWRANAEKVADVLKSGRSAAFLTLGDCLTYSTYSYLLNSLAEVYPEFQAKSVPGISSYQLAASKLNRSLCLHREALTVISGTDDHESLSRLLDLSENVVIMKSYRGSERVAELVRAKGLARKTAVCCNLGLPDEFIIDGIEAPLPEKISYFTLFLVNKNKI